MNSQSDLPARHAETEKTSGRPGPAKHLAYLLLATLLTLNVWILWRSLDTLSANTIEHQFWLLTHPGATDQQRCDAFVRLLGAGNREWRSARLAHLSLKHADFDGAQLERSELESCDFTQSSFVGANLRKANLQMSTLVRADLSLAILTEAYLFKADLTDATLRGADLRSASLEQGDLKNTDFQGSDLAEANLLLAVMTNANLQNANLSWSNLDATDFHGANLDGANLESASIRDAVFTGSNWWRAVGLSSDAIDRLNRDFPPGDDAPPESQEDYEKWLKERAEE